MNPAPALPTLLNPPATLDPRIFSNLPHAMPALVSPRPNPTLLPLVPALIASLRAAHPTADPQNLSCLEAALYLWADDLHTAHELCQNVPTPLGSAWHAVMHRREPDFFNSNYWWRRATKISWALPTTNTPPLTQLITQLLAHETHPALVAFRTASSQSYDPSRFVNLVEQLHEDPALVPTLANLQRLEWSTLFLQTLPQ